MPITGKRNSSVELLRIIAMFSIVYWHAIHHGYLGIVDLPDPDKLVLKILEWALLWHVNVFLLITGFFGLDFKLRTLLSLMLKLVVVSLTIALFAALFLQDKEDFATILGRTKFNLFGGHWWFMRCYIELLLISPILNLAKSLDDKGFIRIFLILLFANIIIGFLFKSTFNSDGFCLNHFVMMYYIGYFIHRFVDMSSVKTKWAFTLFFFSIILTVVLGIKAETFFYGYNNPFVIISAICIFLLFARKTTNNRLINYIASSTLMVYLITDEFPHMRLLYAKLSQMIYDKSDNIWESLAISFLLTVILFIASIAFDKIINPLIRPVANVSTNICRIGVKRLTELTTKHV